MSNGIVTFVPDNSLKQGYLSAFREILTEIRNNKWLVWQLFKRNFFNVYKQSFIGVFWALVMPIFSVGTFIFLNHSGIFSVGDIDVPYPIYALLGMAFWQIFASGLTSSANSLSSVGKMITKINFSKKCLVLAAIGKPIVTLLIQTILITALFIAYGITPTKGAFFAPLVLIPILLLTLGLGFILSLFNAFIRDVGNGLSVFVTFLMFLTPILYAKPRFGTLVHITKYNPMFYFISAGKDLILKGTILELNGFIISSIASALIFGICLFIFHLTETKVAERI